MPPARAAAPRAHASSRRRSCGHLDEARHTAPGGALQMVDHPPPVVAHWWRTSAEECVGDAGTEALGERELRQEVGECPRQSAQAWMPRLLHRASEQLPGLEVRV